MLLFFEFLCYLCNHIIHRSQDFYLYMTFCCCFLKQFYCSCTHLAMECISCGKYYQYFICSEFYKLKTQQLYFDRIANSIYDLRFYSFFYFSDFLLRWYCLTPKSIKDILLLFYNFLCITVYNLRGNRSEEHTSELQSR